MIPPVKALHERAMIRLYLDSADCNLFSDAPDNFAELD